MENVNFYASDLKLFIREEVMEGLGRIVFNVRSIFIATGCIAATKKGLQRVMI